jgi:perosamine synthetase
MFGYPCNIHGLCQVASFHGVPVVEDAAEAVGSSVMGRPCGSFGTVSVMSFNLNKTITSGGGGAILTNDMEMGDRAAHLVATARVKHPWLVEHDEVASNHRMSMLAGALACSQMRRLPRLLRAKRALAKAYKLVLETVDGVVFRDEQKGEVANFWLPTIMVPEGERDAVLTALHACGVLARAAFTPMHRLPMYRGGKFPAADELFERAVCLPAGLELAERFL